MRRSVLSTMAVLVAVSVFAGCGNKAAKNMVSEAVKEQVEVSEEQKADEDESETEIVEEDIEEIKTENDSTEEKEKTSDKTASVKKSTEKKTVVATSKEQNTTSSSSKGTAVADNKKQNTVSSGNSSSSATSKEQDTTSSSNTSAAVVDNKKQNTVSSGNSSSSATSSKKQDVTSSSSSSSTAKPVHTHKWEAVYEDVWVVTKEAWTEQVPVYEDYCVVVCNHCKKEFKDDDEWEVHSINSNGVCGSYTPTVRQKQVGTKPITYEEEGYWTTKKTGEKCACGATK